MTASVWQPDQTSPEVNSETTIVSESFVATEGQSLFVVSSFSYTVGTNSVRLFVQGVKQILGVDFVEVDSTSIQIIGSVLPKLGERVEIEGVVPVTVVMDSVGLKALLASDEGAANVGYKSPKTGSVGRSLNKRMSSVIEAFDFMTASEIASVESGNLLVDVTPKLQLFLAAILETRGRGRGRLNGGLYRGIAGSLVVTSGMLAIEGEGKNQSVLVNFSSSGDLLRFAGSSLPLCSISDMGFQQNVDTTGKLLDVSGVFRFDASNVFFNGAPGGTNLAQDLLVATGTSVYVDGIDAVGFKNYGIRIVGGNDYNISKGTIQANGVTGKPLSIANVIGGACSIQNVYFLEGANCEITNTNFGTFSGVYFDSAQGAVAVSGCEHLYFVDGCEFANRVTTGTGDGSGIIFGNSKSCEVANSMVINNGLNGIVINADTANIGIYNNKIDGNNVTNTAGVVAGVNIAGGAQSFKVIGNTIGNNTALFAGHQKYGIAVGAGASNNYIITDNDVRNNETLGIVDNGTGTNAIVRDNLGYKLGRSVVTPPASTVTYQAGHTPETIYLSGGTVSAVKIPDNVGSTVFTATPCTLHLEPNETMSITYSSAPTMVKQQH